MKRLHVFVMLFMACFWVLSGGVQAQGSWCTIGNLVWNDLNKNGVQDLGEPGLPDIEVSLYSCGELTPTGSVSTSSLPDHATLVAKTRTDVNGNYSFGGLHPFTKYFVAVAVPDGWAASPIFQGTSDEKDSDIFPYLNHSGFICLPEGVNERLSLDAGLFKIQDFDLVTIGDMVFNDCNHNGVQDSGENGIAGVCINIYACDIIPMDGGDYGSLNRKHCKGLKVGETVTDLNGHYQFAELLPGEYCIEIALPHGFRTVPRPNCPDVCNPDVETNMTGCMMFNACTKNMDIDFAICNTEDNCKLAGVGDLVWNDTNKDGIQEKNEPVMPGITVTLYTCGDNNASTVQSFSRRDCIDCKSMKVGTAKTDANGKYLFTNLIPGHYYLKVTTPLAYDVTPVCDAEVNGLDEDCNDNDFADDDNSTWCFYLNAGDPNLCVDAGLVYDPSEIATLGDRVWRDDDADGVQDEREVGVPGVTIKLYECTDPCEKCDVRSEVEMDNCKHLTCGTKLVATAVTDDNGYYWFKNLVPGKYCMKITVPACYVLTSYHRGCYYDNNDFKSDGTTRCLWVEGGDFIDFIDAGLVPNVPDPGMVGDFVWNDANQNGIQDCDEKGVCGVTVELHAADGGATVATTKTDENGRYLFTNVPTNTTYYVKFVLPAQYEFTSQNAGENDDLDSDPCPEKAITANFTLTSGQATMIVDAGMTLASCSVSNYVWDDANNDNIKNADEKVFAGVTIELYNCSSNSLVQSVKTDATGLYTFSNILVDSYYLKVADLPAGYALRQSVTSGDGANPGFTLDGQSDCFAVTKGAASIGKPVILVITNDVASRTGVPTEFGLDQNFPNPFNPSTTIQFGVPQAGQYRLTVYNMLGQEVATLLNGELNAGYHSVVFDASRLTSGVYIYRLSGNNVQIIKKMMLNK